MKRLVVLVALCLVATTTFAAKTDKNIAAIEALAERIVPSVADNFEWRVLPAKGGDRWELSSEGGKIIIAGNNAGSMAVGLNHYLKYYCLTEVSWYAADPVVLPTTLPIVEVPVAAKARVKDRFFLNYCTYGYTMPWWGWKDWERLIDWMALNGVNLPLAITGQESIWYKVWSTLGLTDEEIRNYFTGPAHLPWHRMQNIDRWQSPLPKGWLEGQEELQKQIVARERELCMRPVLPAFAGHVPAELARVMPEAKITKLKHWSDFPDDYACSFLDPMDPAYTKIQKLFLQIQEQTYGTDHIYGIDLFNELTPPSWEPDYLARVSRQVYESLRKADRKAVWLQMGWLFYYQRQHWTPERVEAYLTAPPAKGQLMLDYFCEFYEVWPTVESFYGTPFIWCYLGNFGGNSPLTGNIKEVNRRFENTLANAGPNVSGIGSTLEGFDYNPFVYEYVFEKAWTLPQHNNPTEWVNTMADQRVGFVDENARKAWQILADGVYNNEDYGKHSHVGNPKHRHPLLVTPPQADYKWNETMDTDQRTLISALDHLLKVESDRPSHRFDVVNITRELLSNTFVLSLCRFSDAKKKGDIEAMTVEEDFMCELFEDMDRLMATNQTFMLDKWLQDARTFGTDEAEKDYYESNARSIVTAWGVEGSRLNDYARRCQAGLITSYYGERWELYFHEVKCAVLTKGKYTGEDHQTFRSISDKFETRWWTERIDTFDRKPAGDELQVAREMFAKYRNTPIK
ncbi:MAG: alpha-N-acetylglucosaminidase [Tidjanibacter sp.]|nr:alpha-N-acetylglucosaminidase [Tidjanibacter sp.]